ncbi:MAG: septum formation initiator family protein [Bacteroidales bacterium]|nr:septum formation initiator family protein [Lachnoclostridium sp.]MCM1384447.1 septum formation initiator family protein [Lachnoclostridium sp.]MCM1465227.1 septum formation initiator family protein [Bacteroidales bacterium]
MARHRVVYRSRRQNRFSMFMVMLIVAMIMIAVAVRSVGLRQKIKEKTLEEEALKAQITQEEARSEEIDQYGIYTQTKAFFEEVAKNKLGLVYEGEIVFKEE